MLSTRFASGASLRMARVAALLMLALFALDLGDAWCDPLVPAGESVTMPAAGHPDPCSEICVDDCFCCSSSVPAVRPAVLSEPVPAEVLPLFVSASTSPGYAIPPDHVPLIAN